LAIMLDLESIRLFVLAVDLGNLTRAAEVAGTVQPAVSQRLKQLEAAVGHRLLERTPRFVRPTTEGDAFLAKARALLAAHDDALRFAELPPVRLALGLNDHAIGADLDLVIKRVTASLPAHATLEVRLGMAQPIRAAFDDGALDAIVIRRVGGGGEGEVLGQDPLGWRASGDCRWRPGEPVPLATLGPPCGLRAAAIRRLEQAGLPWREAFVGGSCAALLAAVQAGLGIAPMGAAASGRMPDRGPELGLPSLPPSDIVMFARTGSPAASSAARALHGAVRSTLTGR
jgi:DNA-binding transcriptional LysR family regulator